MFLKKLRIELPYDPTTPSLGTNPQNLKTFIHKDIIHPDGHCSVIHGAQDMKTTKMYFDRGQDKEDVVHIYNGILLSHKKR